MSPAIAIERGPPICHKLAMLIQPWIPLISGFVGAVIGALCNAYLRERSDRRTSKENLVGEIALLSRDALASLLELYQASLPEANAADRWGKLAAAERLMGKGAALEIRVFREYRSRKIRAAFHQLLNRLDSFKDEIVAHEVVEESRLKLGTLWVGQQADTAIELASAAAGIPLIDRARVVFVGFRKVSSEDKAALSFEPEPVPWRYALSLQFEDEIPQEGLDAIRTRTEARVGAMLCAEHGQAAHIALVGPSSNFRTDVEGCCEPFITAVHRRFIGLDT
ncbi:MAG: hypothetical protein WC804_21890 [Sphingomonas sp.]|jgi:hypothetical protein|uniref:hypothetical protein n=1 Tax=Sphingomonas sp. TaxID=28214 RepID=UPI00356270DE